MPLSLTPSRRRGQEILDDPSVDADVRARSLGDVALANALFGGAHVVLAELAPVLERVPAGRMTLLDVGTGAGDLAERARATARRRGVAIDVVGVDSSESLAAGARGEDGRGLVPVCGDALALPFADASVDVVLCSQLLHHFDERDLLQVLRELDRVARVRVIVADLRRSWLAAAGLWVASFPLRFHPVSRHDGVLSVLRGFTAPELADFVRRATGRPARVRRYRGFRIAASWTPREIA